MLRNIKQNSSILASIEELLESQESSLSQKQTSSQNRSMLSVPRDPSQEKDVVSRFDSYLTVPKVQPQPPTNTSTGPQTHELKTLVEKLVDVCQEIRKHTTTLLEDRKVAHTETRELLAAVRRKLDSFEKNFSVGPVTKTTVNKPVARVCAVDIDLTAPTSPDLYSFSLS